MRHTINNTHTETHVLRTWALSPRHRGVAMLLVLIAVAMATILSMSFLASQSTTHGVSQNVQKHAQARSVAESALVAAIHYVQTDTDFRTDKAHGQWASGVSFNGGTFDVYGYDGLDTDDDGVVDDTDGDLTDDDSDPVTLTVVGFYDGVSHRVNAVVTPGSNDGLEVLMVVGDASSLSTQDQDKIDLVESWGMNVTLISDHDNQAAFDAAAALADVAYVSASVVSGTVGSKTNGFTIGVVSDEDDFNDDLLVSDSAGSHFDDTAIDVVDNSHYITSTVDPGDMDDLAIVSSTQQLSRVNGTLGSGATVLATRDSNSDPTLVAVDVDGQLEDGSSAAGRRVLLPWGTSGIDITELNDAGRTILKRSLEWAGVEITSAGGTYDYATRTQSTDIWAYDGQESSDPPTNNTSPSSEFSGGEYDDIEVDDSDSHSVNTSSNNTHSTMRFVIQIDEDEADVTSMGASFIGRNYNEHGVPDDGVIFYIWNYTSGEYEVLEASADTEAEVTLAGTIAANITDYIGGASDDTVILLAQSADRQLGNRDNILYCDYVSLTINTGAASGSGPRLITLYEFQEVPSAEPSLVAHWEMDDAGGGGTASYDFASGSQGSDIWAYDGQSSSAPPSNETTPSSELSGGEYNDIENNDSDSHSVNTSSNNNHSMMRYVFQIAEDESSVGQIDVTWIGSNYNEHGPRTDGVELYIWNYTSGSYEQLDVSADTEAEVTLTGTISSNLADYIGGGSDDTLTILAQSRDKQTGGRDNILYCDYVSISVNTLIVASEDTNGNGGIGSGGTSDSAGGNGDGGTSFDFDGVDGAVEVAHDNAYLLDDGSLSFWFNSDDLTGHHALVSKDSSGNDTGGHLHVYTDGSVLKARLQSTTTTYEVQSTGLSTGTWYHVVVSWGAGGLKLFRNGSEEDTDSYTGGLGTNSGGAGNYEAMLFGGGTWNSDDLVSTPTDNYFDGRLDDIRIYDGGFNETQADNVYNGSDPGTGDARVVYDTGGYGVALNLEIEDVDNVSWVGGGGLTFDAATRVVSPTAATKLYSALTATNQFSVEVQFTPTNTSQSGPARIVSYSGGASDTNVTFGQDAGAYVARLDTTTTTAAGTPEADSGNMLSAGVEEHVIISYDGAEITMYNSDGSSTTLARSGDLDWDNTFDLLMGNEAVDGYGWLGTLSRVAIYDQAFNQTQADNVFGGLPPGDGSASGGAGSVNWVEP